MSQAMQPTAHLIQTVNQLMHEGFEIDQAKLVPEATLQGDLGLDSLDAVDMLVYIEEKMGVRIEGERLKSVKTLADVYILAAESVPRLDSKSEPKSEPKPKLNPQLNPQLSQEAKFEPKLDAKVDVHVGSHLDAKANARQ